MQKSVDLNPVDLNQFIKVSFSKTFNVSVAIAQDRNYYNCLLFFCKLEHFSFIWKRAREQAVIKYLRK